MNPNIQAYVTLIKDIITGLSALTAAIIAILGLQAWKKQLKGKTEYELAQRLLRNVYKVRDALALVRNPFQSAAEISQAMKEANIERDPLKDPSIQIRSEGAVYQRRWQKVQDAYLNLESVAFEAEAIWGQSVKDNLKPLQECTSTLASTIQMYLSHLEKPPRKYDEKAKYKEDAIIYGFPGDADQNFFSSEIIKAVSKMEDFLRPLLKI